MSERPVPYIWHILGSMPMTSVRIQASVLAMLATATRVVLKDWSPPLEWLGFLSAWGVVDLAQFGKNRETDYRFVAANKPTPMVSTSTLTQPDGTVSETVTAPMAPTPLVKPPESGA